MRAEEEKKKRKAQAHYLTLSSLTHVQHPFILIPKPFSAQTSFIPNLNPFHQLNLATTFLFLQQTTPNFLRSLPHPSRTLHSFHLHPYPSKPQHQPHIPHFLAVVPFSLTQPTSPLFLRPSRLTLQSLITKQLRDPLPFHPHHFTEPTSILGFQNQKTVLLLLLSHRESRYLLFLIPSKERNRNREPKDHTSSSQWTHNNPRILV